MSNVARLRAQAKGRGKKGCRVCGEPTAAYLTLHVKEPNVSQAGRMGKDKPNPGTKSGATIISRSFSFCDAHLGEAWEGCLSATNGAKQEAG